MSGPQSAPAAPAVEIDKVRVVYGSGADSVVALEQATLEVARGTFLTVLGPSGCGKSTLLNLVAGFSRPSSGTVRVEGEAVSGPSVRRGVVFQDSAALFPWLSVADNIAFGPKANGVRRAETRERTEWALDLVGLTKFAKRYPHELSGGMRQLTAIARILVMQPPVLLMDEPFAALDALTRERMQERLIEIWQRIGATIVFITHSVDEAIYLGEEVVVMSGRPGTIKARVPVGLVRPRIGTSPEFNALKADLLAHLFPTPASKDLS